MTAYFDTSTLVPRVIEEERGAINRCAGVDDGWQDLEITIVDANQ